jgi:hypothetical protein
VANDLVKVSVLLPASTNPTLSVRNATSSGTELKSVTGRATAGRGDLWFQFNGTAWEEAGANLVAFEEAGGGGGGGGAASETPTNLASFTTPTRRYSAASLASSADGSSISSLAGLHSGGSAATASGGAQPTKQTIGNFNVIRFDGTSDFLTFPTVTDMSAFTFVGVLKKNSSASAVVLGAIGATDPRRDEQLVGLGATAPASTTVYTYDRAVLQGTSSSVNLSALAVVAVRVTAPTTVTAGEFATGRAYVITDTGDTDFTEIGAENSDPGTRFVATGAGSGTGTASTNDVTFSVNGTSAGTAQAIFATSGADADLIGATNPTGGSAAGFAAMDLAEAILWNSAISDSTSVINALKTHYGIS